MERTDARLPAPSTLPPSAPRPRRRARRVLVVVGGLVAITLVGGVGLFLFGRETPRPVTVDEARERTDGATVSTAPPGAFGPPAAGVYLYEGSGTEHTSFPPLTEQQGPTMPATVAGDGEGCWRFRIDYDSHHWQDWRLCASPSGITSTGGASFARRDFGAFVVDNTSTFTCEGLEPWVWRDMRPGESRRATCRGTSTAMDGTTASSGTTTYVGDEEISVGGHTVTSVHLRYERTISGAQDGEETADWWVDPHTLLPLRNEHHLSVTTRVGTTDITYTEDSTYALTSLDPT